MIHVAQHKPTSLMCEMAAPGCLGVCETVTHIGCDAHIREINTAQFSPSIASDTRDQSLVYTTILVQSIFLFQFGQHNKVVSCFT
jgi:hypothetical protein